MTRSGAGGTAGLYIGLMSGTSTDGIDGVLCRFQRKRVALLGHRAIRFDSRLRRDILALNCSGDDELHRAASVAHRMALASARIVKALLATHNLSPSDVVAIGSHGQTVRHRPPQAGHRASALAYSLQVNNPALLAEWSGIDVVADFRNADIAAGGQGAPLVPAFHRAMFGRPDRTIVVVNIGGIANLTILPADGPILGFDSGPGNVLLDAWCEVHRRQRFDRDGTWAASGVVHPALLGQLMKTPYLRRSPPKSTGRDLFSLAWLESRIKRSGALHPRDVQATLAEFTAATIADAVKQSAKNAESLVVCGGGAYNGNLLKRLMARLPTLRVTTSQSHGIAPDQVEATAFAWLAMRRMQRAAGNIADATGASGPRVLGAVYPRPPR